MTLLDLDIPNKVQTYISVTVGNNGLNVTTRCLSPVKHFDPLPPTEHQPESPHVDFLQQWWLLTKKMTTHTMACKTVLFKRHRSVSSFLYSTNSGLSTCQMQQFDPLVSSSYLSCLGRQTDTDQTHENIKLKMF